MNIGDVGGAETPSQTSLAQLSNGSGSASEGWRISSSCIAAEHVMRKEFTEKALDILNDLRHNGQLCDAAIRSGDTVFQVHRNIMSACSAYFRALFTSKEFRTRDSLHQPQEVVLTDVTPEVLGCLIDYAYSRQVLISEDNVQAIFHAADRSSPSASSTSSSASSSSSSFVKVLNVRLQYVEDSDIM